MLYMLDPVHDTAIWTTRKIKAIRELLRRATAHVREHAPSLYSRVMYPVLARRAPERRVDRPVEPLQRVAHARGDQLADRQPVPAAVLPR